MYMPGKIKIETIKFDSMIDCKLIISINPLNDFLNKTTLHVFAQYGEPPTQQEYDVKFIISQPASFVSTSPYIKQLEDNSFMVWNFTELKYGHMNNSKVYLSMYYDGPMPDLVYKENRDTYDVLVERGSFNYSLKSFCADCSYWNEQKRMWTKDGCKVSVVDLNIILINILIVLSNHDVLTHKFSS